MTDIFEGAKFGDKFILQNGNVYLYCGFLPVEDWHILYDQEGDIHRYSDSGVNYTMLNENFNIAGKMN